MQLNRISTVVLKIASRFIWYSVILYGTDLCIRTMWYFIWHFSMALIFFFRFDLLFNSSWYLELIFFLLCVCVCVCVWKKYFCYVVIWITMHLQFLWKLTWLGRTSSRFIWYAISKNSGQFSLPRQRWIWRCPGNADAPICKKKKEKKNVWKLNELIYSKCWYVLHLSAFTDPPMRYYVLLCFLVWWFYLLFLYRLIKFTRDNSFYKWLVDDIVCKL